MPVSKFRRWTLVIAGLGLLAAILTEGTPYEGILGVAGGAVFLLSLSFYFPGKWILEARTDQQQSRSNAVTSDEDVAWKDVRLPFPPDAQSLTSKAHLVRANQLTGALAKWADRDFAEEHSPAIGSEDEFKSALVASVVHAVLARRVSPDEFFQDVLIPFTKVYGIVDDSAQSNLTQEVHTAAGQIGRAEEVGKFLAAAGRNMASSFLGNASG